MHLQTPSTTIFLTTETLLKYRQEVAKLKQELPEVLQRLKDAREMGDLSENGAYKYAKLELGTLRRKLSRLEAILSSAKAITRPSDSSQVQLGSTVAVQKETEPITKLQLVGRLEADPSKHTISSDSPLGSALLGKKVGEQVVVTTPRGSVTYTVCSIE